MAASSSASARVSRTGPSTPSGWRGTTATPSSSATCTPSATPCPAQTSAAGGCCIRPAARSLDKIWRVGTELADVRAIAEAGDHLFVGTSKKRTLSENRRQHAAVIATFREHANAHQRVALSRHVFVHPDGAEARRRFEAALPSELRARRASPAEPYSLEEAILVGSPREIAAALDADPLLPLVDDLLVQVAPAKLTVRQ